jgi:preprotein translocase subunit Sec63
MESYIKELKKKYPNLAIIEVWENVLFLRMTRGKCIFDKKKGTPLEYAVVGQWIFVDQGSYNENKKVYRELSKKHHPDLAVNEKDKEKRNINFKKLYKAYSNLRDRDGEADNYVEEIPMHLQKWHIELTKHNMEKYGVPF